MVDTSRVTAPTACQMQSTVFNRESIVNSSFVDCTQQSRLIPEDDVTNAALKVDAKLWGWELGENTEKIAAKA